MQVAQGRIIVVQEQRFRLKTADGRVLLLSLPQNSRLSEADLERLHRQDSEVLVRYEGEPNFESAVVRSVEPLLSV